jgi:enoyl-CoA hydratase
VTLLQVRVEGGVALLTLDDPDRRNVLGAELADSLIATVAELESRDDVAVLVLTGAGRAFCAGADLADLLAAADGDVGGVQKVYDAFGAVAEFPRPTIAAVNGPAVGAGLNLALACDVRVAGRSARFDSRFLTIGIHPGGGHAWMLERLAGPQTAAAMLLFGEVVGADDAARRGLVWEVVDDADLVPASLRLAARAAEASPVLLRDMKATLRSAPGLSTRAPALAMETERQLESLRRPEAAELIGRLRAAISSPRPAR